MKTSWLIRLMAIVIDEMNHKPTKNTQIKSLFEELFTIIDGFYKLKEISKLDSYIFEILVHFWLKPRLLFITKGDPFFTEQHIFFSPGLISKTLKRLGFNESHALEKFFEINEVVDSIFKVIHHSEVNLSTMATFEKSKGPLSTILKFLDIPDRNSLSVTSRNFRTSIFPRENRDFTQSSVSSLAPRGLASSSLFLKIFKSQQPTLPPQKPKEVLVWTKRCPPYIHFQFKNKLTGKVKEGFFENPELYRKISGPHQLDFQSYKKLEEFLDSRVEINPILISNTIRFQSLDILSPELTKYLLKTNSKQNCELLKSTLNDLMTFIDIKTISENSKRCKIGLLKTNNAVLSILIKDLSGIHVYALNKGYKIQEIYNKHPLEVFAKLIGKEDTIQKIKLKEYFFSGSNTSSSFNINDVLDKISDDLFHQDYKTASVVALEALNELETLLNKIEEENKKLRFSLKL
ncbi:MAG: hypothetical protein ACKOAD_06220 [Gammaproteobacteria bacterium]